MINQLRPIDTISVVAYGSTVSVIIEGASGNEKKKIIAAIEKLQPSGPTPGAEGIIEAYRVVNKRLIVGGNNRIILASDGDFNVGLTTEKQLEELIDDQKKQGVYLTCLGVGMGNYKDSKLSILAYKGNGNFSYIDNDLEAEKVLVTEMSQTLFSVAGNVHLVANFNPLLVKDYRLIGYDNNKAALVDTASRLMGGEIGSGHSLAAVFELTLQPDGLLNRKVIADMRVNYQLPNSTKQAFISFNCPNSLTPLAFADSNYKRALTLLMFSMKLKSSECMSHYSWKDLQIMAHLNFKESSNYLYREFSGLVDLAKKIYTSRRGRKELRAD
jgi:Ca-activated chloride channel family protein